MDWSNFRFPHVKYIAHPTDNRSVELYYGGSSDIGLVVGEKYKLTRALFTEDKNSTRISVWYCKGNDNISYNFINLNDFYTLEELRDKKINDILGDKTYTTLFSIIRKKLNGR
jgi:hypothetical protein